MPMPFYPFMLTPSSRAEPGDPLCMFYPKKAPAPNWRGGWRRMPTNADIIGGLNTEAQFIMPFHKDGSAAASRRLATAVRKEIAKINKLHKNNTEFAGFAVLKSPVVPSILVETAFISNPHEEEKLHDKNFQQKMAAAIATGVEIYMRQDPCEKNGKQTY